MLSGNARRFDIFLLSLSQLIVISRPLSLICSACVISRAADVQSTAVEHRMTSKNLLNIRKFWDVCVNTTENWSQLIMISVASRMPSMGVALMFDSSKHKFLFLRASRCGGNH